MKFEITGAIFNSLDDFYFAGTPGVYASDIADGIRWLGKGNDIELVIDSEGGDIRGGQMIAAALNEWSKEGHSLTIIIGALCASAAANLLTQIECKATVIAHRDTQIMFHSCYTWMCGGAEALRDQANFIDKYNESVKAWLCNNTALKLEEIEPWFREGRCGWLSAEEAKAAGLVDSILGNDSAAIPTAAEDSKGGMLAAFAKDARKQALERKKTKGAEKMAEKIEKKTEVAKEVLPKEVKAEEVKEEVPEKVVKETAEENKPEDGAEDLKKLIEEQAAKIAELEQKLNAMCEEKETAKAALNRMTAGLKASASAEKTAPAFTDWKQVTAAIAKQAKNTREFDALFIKAKAEHADLYKAFMNR